MAELHETYMGRQFYESTMPRIARALERIAHSLEAISVPSPTLAQCEILADKIKEEEE